MSDQRCKNCKHWKQDKTMVTWDATKTKAHPCIHPYGTCYRIKIECEIGVERDSESVLDEEPAFVEDGSDYHAALRPGPEFGCILWEVKS